MGATLGTDNMGVSALTAGTIEAGLHRWHDTKYILLDYEKTPILFHYNSTKGLVAVELLNMRFSKKPFANNIAVIILLQLSR